MACSLHRPTTDTPTGRTTTGSERLPTAKRRAASEQLQCGRRRCDTCVEQSFPAGAQIVSVAANGRSVVLNETATGPRANHTGTDVLGVPSLQWHAAAGRQPVGVQQPVAVQRRVRRQPRGNWLSTGTIPGVHGIGSVTRRTINHWDMGTATVRASEPDQLDHQRQTRSWASDDGTNNRPATTPRTCVPSTTQLREVQGTVRPRVTMSPWRVQPGSDRRRSWASACPPTPSVTTTSWTQRRRRSTLGRRARHRSVRSGMRPSTDIDNDGRVGSGRRRRRRGQAAECRSGDHQDGRREHSEARGGQVRYTIVASNAGPAAVTGATVNDSFPSTLSGPINWTCTPAGGATCGGSEPAPETSVGR